MPALDDERMRSCDKRGIQAFKHCLPNVVAITCGAQRRQVYRLVGQHSKRGVWHRYASL